MVTKIRIAQVKGLTEKLKELEKRIKELEKLKK
jgi:phosphatidylserine decarboxylase